MARQFRLSNVMLKFIECLRDDRGQAMTEYLLVAGIMVALACYLYHPDNGLYKAARDQYELTKLLLMFPGP